MTVTISDAEIRRIAANLRGAAPGPETNGNGKHHPAGPGESLIPEPPPWPDPPDEAIYHGLAGEIVKLVEPQTEADPVAILAQVLVMFGNAAGRWCYWQVEADRHFGNLYCCLVGATGTGRKGVSKGRALQVFADLQNLGDQWVWSRIYSGLSTGEGLIHAVRDERSEKHPVKDKGRVVDYEDVIADSGVEDKRLLVIEPEFGRVLKAMEREGNTLSARIREGWDSGNFRGMTKTPVTATGAHVSIIGHITQVELARLMGEVEAANGLGNRFLWLAARRSKLLPLGGSPLDLGEQAKRVSKAVAEATVPGHIGLTRPAEEMFRARYEVLTARPPGILGAITSRAESQVRRLAMLYALLDCRRAVGIEHLQAAMSLWDYCEASCRWIYGDSTGNRLADEIIAALRSSSSGEGLTHTQISGLFSRHESSLRIGQAIALLVRSGLATQEKIATGGRPAARLVLIAAEKKEN